MLALRIAAASFLVLFLEIALIRWLPAQIRLLSFFSNFILLASFLGIGLTSLFGQDYVGQGVTPLETVTVPGLADLPFVGPVLFDHDPLTYLSFAAAGGLWWFLFRTRRGLVTRTAGEDHQRVYDVTVWLNDRALGSGRGTSKKLAEEAAAHAALEVLKAEAGRAG